MHMYAMYVSGTATDTTVSTPVEFSAQLYNSANLPPVMHPERCWADWRMNARGGPRLVRPLQKRRTLTHAVLPIHMTKML